MDLIFIVYFYNARQLTIPFLKIKNLELIFYYTDDLRLNDVDQLIFYTMTPYLLIFSLEKSCFQHCLFSPQTLYPPLHPLPLPYSYPLPLFVLPTSSPPE